MDDTWRKMNEISRTVDQARKLYEERFGRTEELLRSLRSPYQSLYDQIESLKGISTAQQLLQSAEVSSILDREIRQLRESLEWSPASVALRDLNREVEQTRDMIGEVYRQAAMPSSVLAGYSVWEEMIRDLRRDAVDFDSLSRTPNLAARFVAPTRRFGTFLRETTEELAATNDESTRTALEGSLVLAGDIVIASSALTSEFDVDDSAEETDVLSGDGPALVLPFVQRAELILARENLDSVEVPDLGLYSPAYQTAQHVRAAIHLLTEVNTTRKLKQHPETFKPTNRAIVAINDLFFIVPTEQRSFADFIDALYFLLFEAAGDEKPRFLAEHGGQLERAECEVIWLIKRLRNFFRHDSDHGRDSTIQKKFTSLSEDMASFGLSHLPRTTAEYRRLHHLILRRTVEFLRVLRDRT